MIPPPLSITALRKSMADTNGDSAQTKTISIMRYWVVHVRMRDCIGEYSRLSSDNRCAERGRGRAEYGARERRWKVNNCISRVWRIKAHAEVTTRHGGRQLSTVRECVRLKSIRVAVLRLHSALLRVVIFSRQFIYLSLALAPRPKCIRYRFTALRLTSASHRNFVHCIAHRIFFLRSYLPRMHAPTSFHTYLSTVVAHAVKIQTLQPRTAAQRNLTQRTTADCTAFVF